MNIEDIYGKNVAIYPDNFITKNLLSMKRYLKFNIMSIIDNLEINVEISENMRLSIIKKLEKCQYLIILDYSPKSLCLYPVNKYYLMILETAIKLKISIISPYFNKVIYENIFKKNDSKIIISKIQEKYKIKNWSIFNKQPIIMLVSTRYKMNIHFFEMKINKLLKKYNISNSIISSNPCKCLFQNEISNLIVNKELQLPMDHIILFDGPLQGNPFLQIKNEILFDDSCQWKIVDMLKPDGILLVIHENDSIDIILETIDYLRWRSIKVFGIIEEQNINPWRTVYIESKLGIPVSSLKDLYCKNKLVSNIINFFSCEIDNIDFRR